MAATATWDPVGKAWTLTTGLPGSPVWTRVVRTVDGLWSTRRIGTGTVVVDGTAPVDGSELHWTAAVSGQQEEVVQHPAAEPLPVLSVPALPALAAAGVTVRTANGWDVQGRPSFYEVLDRPLPWVEPQPPNERTGEMVLDIPHDGRTFPGPTLRAVRAMLATGQPMLLRTICRQRVETVAFVPLSWSERHPGQGNEHGPSRRITIRWRAVEPLWGESELPVARVWQEVPGEFPTWADVKNSGLSWRELAYG